MSREGWGLSSEYHQHKHRLGQTDDTFVNNKDRSESDEGGVRFFVFRFGYFELNGCLFVNRRNPEDESKLRLEGLISYFCFEASN